MRGRHESLDQPNVESIKLWANAQRLMGATQNECVTGLLMFPHLRRNVLPPGCIDIIGARGTRVPC